MREKDGDSAARLGIETRLAGLRQPTLDRATTWPYREGDRVLPALLRLSTGL
jgi:hypothetical protein